MNTKSSTTIPNGSTRENVEKAALFYFYRLIDPIDGKTKYIGRTVDISSRMRNHIYEAKKNNRNKRERWIIYLLRRNLFPIVKTIYSQYCNIEEAIRLEKMYVTLYSKYYELKNSPDNYLGSVLTGTPVHQYNLEGFYVASYANANQANIHTGVKDCNILRCCKNINGYGTKTAGNYFWSFERLDKYPFDYVENWREQKGKEVFQYSLEGKLLKSYLTARKAQRETGVSFKKISACCNQRQKSAGGFIWKFE
jgi:hypothetical protein